jgi:hypothetical protein
LEAASEGVEAGQKALSTCGKTQEVNICLACKTA